MLLRSITVASKPGSGWLPSPRAEGRGPDSRAGNAPSRMGCPQSQCAREIPGLRARARSAQAGPAPTCSPTRSSPKPPHVMPATGRNWTPHLGARSIPHAGRTRQPRIADLCANPQAPGDARETADDPLWRALYAVPAEGTEISELIRITDWEPTKPYGTCGSMPRRAAPSRSAGHASGRGPPRSCHRERSSRRSSRPARRASARKRPNGGNRTNDETSTERHPSARQPAINDEEREAIREAGADDATLTNRVRIPGTDRRSGSGRDARRDPARHSSTPDHRAKAPAMRGTQ